LGSAFVIEWGPHLSLGPGNVAEVRGRGGHSAHRHALDLAVVSRRQAPMASDHSFGDHDQCGTSHATAVSSTWARRGSLRLAKPASPAMGDRVARCGGRSLVSARRVGLLDPHDQLRVVWRFDREQQQPAVADTSIGARKAGGGVRHLKKLRIDTVEL